MILGVGNDFRGDDAAGLLAVRRLRERLPKVRVIECDGDLAGAVERWTGEDAVIVIDAVSSGAEAGTIHRFEAHARPLSSRFFRGSTHAFGVAEAVELARALDRLPHRLIVYGIEGASFATGDSLSPQVAAAVEEVVIRVVEEVSRDA